MQSIQKVLKSQEWHPSGTQFQGKMAPTFLDKKWLAISDQPN